MKPFLPKANKSKPQFEFPPILQPPFQRRNRGCDSSSSSGEREVPARGIWTIADPNKNDVLCGRSNRLHNHAGNVQFREIVASNRMRYTSKSTKKAEKANIATHIVQQIRSMTPSGRFLKEDPKTGLWFDIGDVKAIKKVGQELRKNSNEPRSEINSAATPDNNQNEEETNGLNQDDFPVGRPYPFHPKIKLLNQMVEELLSEYTEADKISQRTLGNGQVLRSRHEIINLVVESLTSGTGKFKKKQKDGNWVVDKNYTESKLRTRIINAFNNLRDKFKDTDSAHSTTCEKMTIVTESTCSVTMDSNGMSSTVASLPRGADYHDATSASLQPSRSPDRSNADGSVEKGGKIVFDQVWQQISSQYDECSDQNFDLPFSKEELAPDIRMLDDISTRSSALPTKATASLESTGQVIQTPRKVAMAGQKMDGVEPMEVEFGRSFKPIEENMSVSDVSGLSSANTMSTISGMRSTISGMRSNLSGLRSNISGFSSNAESSAMGGRSRTSLTLASVFSTGKTIDTYSRRKRNKKR